MALLHPGDLELSQIIVSLIFFGAVGVLIIGGGTFVLMKLIRWVRGTNTVHQPTEKEIR